MRRGTTPTMEFEVPFKAADVSTLWVTFSQSNEPLLKILQAGGPLPPIILTKTSGESGMAIEDNLVTVQLTQVESLKFDTTGLPLVFAQIRVLFTNGEADASDVVEFPVKVILKDGVIA